MGPQARATRAAVRRLEGASVNQALSRYLVEVMQECQKKLPSSALYRDEDLVRQYPQTWPFYLSYADVMTRACKARREGAENRADALEMAFDSLLAKTGYVRVGEVYRTDIPKLITDTPGEMVKVWTALVVERD